MNIIVTTHDWLNPIVGGGALRTVKVAEEFKRRGHRVTILGPSKSNYISGMRAWSLPAPTKRRSQVLSAIKFNFRLSWRFIHLIWNTNLIFVHNAAAAASVAVLSRLFRKQFILDITDIHAEYLKYGKPNFFEKLLTPLLLWIEYWIICSADRVIVVTEEMRRHVVQEGLNPDKVTVVYDGAELDKYNSEKIENSKFGIIHLGWVDKQHGLHGLMEASPEIIKALPNVKFYIIGDGRELPRVKKLAKEFRVYNRFLFTGFVPHPQTMQYLRQAAIGVILRPDTLPNNLVVTLKLLAYWATGTVVVSSRLKGIEEIAEDGKDIVFFEPGNWQDLAQKIISLARDPELVNHLRRNGLEKVRKFDWRDLIPRIVDFSLGNS